MTSIQRVKGLERENKYTKVCVAAPARLKDTNSQLDEERALNSDAMVGCVAKTSELSALEVTVPTKRTRTILNTVADDGSRDCAQ